LTHPESEWDEVHKERKNDNKVDVEKLLLQEESQSNILGAQIYHKIQKRPKDESSITRKS
jgi:hypothetical protein